MSKPSVLCRFAAALVRALLRVFFRRVEVTGRENVPAEGGGIFIAWHPNALVDGALILSRFPGRMVVGVRHGLLRWPLLGSWMRALGADPVYRRRDLPPGADDSVRRDANERSLESMAAAVASGAFALLFPEGQSHDEPFPTELKTGAARLYYRARELAAASEAPPVILPVGLHYDRKHLFRSSALVAFHPPFEPTPELRDPPPAGCSEEERKARSRALTSELEEALREVVHATESWDLHHAMHRARKLLRAERARRTGASLERPKMKERVLVFSRLWSAYNERARTHPAETRELLERIQRYDSDLKALGMEDHELYGGRLLSTALAVKVALQALAVYFVLPPIFLMGYVVNLPAAALVWAASRWGAAARKDVATLKLLTGAVSFPLVWLGVAFLIAWGDTRLSALYPRFPGAPLPTGALAFCASALSALVVLHYQRLASQTLHALRVRLTRWRQSRTLERLRAERAELYRALLRLARGLDPAGLDEAGDGRESARVRPSAASTLRG